MRDEAWRRRFAMQDHFTTAKPGRGHLALASLYRAGKVPARGDAEYRQPASGFRRRGRTTSSNCTAIPPTRSCLDCGERYDLAWVRQRFDANDERAPDCGCGGFIKTATVSFGQAMPADAMARAEQLTMQCDLFLAIGSSLVVWPAAGFPLMAKRNGAALVIINREPTEFDELADLVVRHDIGDVLGPFIAH